LNPARAGGSDAMRVVLWGTYDTGKPRVRILRDGLRANGVEVIECHAPVWRGIEDKSQVAGPWRWARLLARILLAYPRLLWRYLRLPRHDWVLVAYPAIPDILLLRLFAWLRRVPIAMDWFLSAYDTVVLDRRLVGRRHPLAWVLWLTEAMAVRLADVPFMDTRAHAARMETLFRLAPGRCGGVWVGVEDAVFHAVPEAHATADTAMATRILFYGQFIPLHGVPTIVEAARLTREQPIDWLLVGRGQEAARVRTMLEATPLPRLAWREWVDYGDLLGHIRSADLCLGIFGTSDKAASVIPNKVFQALAAGAPVVTRDSPAIRELLDCIAAPMRLVPAGDAAALAAAVAAQAPSRASPDQLVAITDAISPRAIGRQLLALLARRERR